VTEYLELEDLLEAAAAAAIGHPPEVRDIGLLQGAVARPGLAHGGIGSLSEQIRAPRWGSALNAVAEIDDLRVERTGFDELEIDAALLSGKERDAAAKEYRVDHRPVLVDQA
jgi:hypothetical protein